MKTVLSIFIFLFSVIASANSLLAGRYVCPHVNSSTEYVISNVQLPGGIEVLHLSASVADGISGSGIASVSNNLVFESGKQVKTTTLSLEPYGITFYENGKIWDGALCLKK